MEYLPREVDLDSEVAQGLVEYALIMALVVIPVITVLTLAFPRIQEVLQAVINQLGEGPPAL